MIIDMHNHTNVSSPCSALYPEELLETARSLGIEGVCVTEHNTLRGADVALEIGKRMGFPVFRGMEVSSELGDMLVFGYYKDLPEKIPLDVLCHTVHNAGGVVFAAHPFFLKGGWNLYSAMRIKKRLDLEFEWRQADILKQLDGLEIRNGHVGHAENLKAELLAKNLNIFGIGGSDAHRVEMIGAAATVFKKRIHTENELVQALKKGDYQAIYLN